MTLPPLRVECRACRHFRPERLASHDLPSWRKATAINNALMEIRKEERSIQAAEAEEIALAARRDDETWSRRPRTRAHCAVAAAAQRYLICEVKNHQEDCPDFESIAVAPRIETRCAGCAFYRPGERDPYPPQGPYGPELQMKRMEGVDSDVALELVTLFHSEGVNPNRTHYHDYCHRHGRALPYANQYRDCTDRTIGNEAQPMFDGARRLAQRTDEKKGKS